MRGQDAVNTDHRLSSAHGSFQTSKCLHFISSPHKPFILATEDLLWIFSGFWLVNILHTRLWLAESCCCSLSRSVSPSSGVTASSISLISEATLQQLFWIWINNQSCNTWEILYHKCCVLCLSVCYKILWPLGRVPWISSWMVSTKQNKVSPDTEDMSLCCAIDHH